MTRTIMQRLVARAIGEFNEMPGLKLSVWQAARLFGVEHATSEWLLAELVKAGFLLRTRDGLYLRSSAR